MADNFLENHYAEYEARKAAWLKAKKLGKKSALKPMASPKKTDTGTTSASQNSTHDTSAQSEP